MALFNTGLFTLASGKESNFKIDCEALTIPDWDALAFLVATNYEPYGIVEGVPTGGLSFAAALDKYATGNGADGLLIVDDVLTTGDSIEKQRGDRTANVTGLVVFSRGITPLWVDALFQMPIDSSYTWRIS